MDFVVHREECLSVLSGEVGSPVAEQWLPVNLKQNAFEIRQILHLTFN